MVYRVEVSPNARSSCKATTCGKAKIEKGELRLGTWVKGPGFESWSWRHWGCFTPQQIVNARKPLIPEDEEDEEGMEIDMKLFDGWEELSDEQKDKVRIALEVGHVDDEDWKGDVALNRKGAKKARGKGTPAAKKGKKKDDDDEEEEAVATDEEPAPKKSTKKTSTASTTTTSKKRTPAKKSAPTPTPSPSASPEPAKPPKSTTSKRAAKPVTEPTRPRSSRATAATPKKYTEVNESADEDSPPTTRKPRTPGRNAKPAKDGKKSARKGRGKKAGGDSDTEGEGEDAEMALHADEGAGEDTVDPPAPKAQSKGRDGGRKRGATAVDDIQGEIGEEEEQPKKKRTKAKPTPTKKEQSVKTKKATTTPVSDKKTKAKAKDSAKETSEAKDKGELGKSIFGGE